MSDIPDFPNLDDDDESEYLGRFDMDSEGEYQVDVFRDLTFDPIDDVSWDFQGLFEAIGFDTQQQDNLLEMLTIPLYDGENTARIDIGGENVRGGYDVDEVIDFLNHTGFWGLGSVYYDAEFDEYFVDLEDVSG